MLALLLAATTTKLASGYLLGEGPDDPLFQRCWQNGNLLAACPSGMNIHWNFSTTEEWVEGYQYDLEVNITWSSNFSSHVVHWQDQQLLPHINVHSCKFELGRVCIPFISANGESVSHTSVIKSDTPGLFDSHVVLTEGAWNVIAHARAYLNDTAFYPHEGDTACTSHEGLPDPFPWKLDVAIGQSHDVAPPPIIDVATSVAGWKVFMFVLGLLMGFFIFYKMYQHCKKSNVEDLERLSPEKQLRKSLLFETCTILIAFSLGFFDFITDALSLHQVQQNKKIPSMLVVLYFGLIIFVSIFFAVVLLNSIKSLSIVYKEFKEGLVDITSEKMVNVVNGEENDQNIIKDEENQETTFQKQFTTLVQKGDVTQQYTKIQRSIAGEKMSLLMAVCEDTPMTIFNSILIFNYNITSKTILVSFVINALMMGYKVSGIERLWLNMQLKRKLDQMCGAVKISRAATKLVDPKEIYSKLVDVGRELTSI